MTTKETNGTILVVDDEPGIREVVAMLCEEITPSIVTAENGAVALEIIKTRKVHAIISDINMPVMNGLRLLAEIRSLGIEVPFVVLSAYGDRAAVAEALRLGANDFMDKPFDDDTLLAVMGKACELGLSVEAADAEVERAYQSSGLPADKIVELKKMRRAIWIMKKDSELYLKKKAPFT